MVNRMVLQFLDSFPDKTQDLKFANICEETSGVSAIYSLEFPGVLLINLSRYMLWICNMQTHTEYAL